MKIGILGAGNMGCSFGQVWAAQGHIIMFGVRDASSAATRAALDACGSQAQAGSLAEAAAFGEVVVLAVHWPAVKQALAQAGSLASKILIDLTNRFAPPEPGEGASAAADVARQVPGAQVFKAFNMVGPDQILGARSSPVRNVVFVCGDDAAKPTVMRLVADTGLDPVDGGPLDNAVYVEMLVQFFVHVMQINGPDLRLRFSRE